MLSVTNNETFQMKKKINNKEKITNTAKKTNKILKKTYTWWKLLVNTVK